MRRTTIRRLTILAATVLATVAFASPAWAATFTVDRNDDPIPVAGAGACTSAANDCSLRGAMEKSDANGQTDTINFALPAGPQTITLADALTVENDTPANDLTINGPGQAALTVRQSVQLRVFQIVGKTTINGITISGGRSPNNAGGVLNGGILTLNDTTVTDNQALGTVELTGSGGGIYNNDRGATLTLNRSTVSANKANTATGSGGGIYNFGGTTTLNDSTVSDNQAGSNSRGFGGGITNLDGTLTLNRSTVSTNRAGDRGGGIFSNTAFGGFITTIRNSTISGNVANSGGGLGGGGGIYNFNGRTAIEYSTITNNSAALFGDGSGVGSHGNSSTRTEVLSSIVSANTNTDVDFVDGAANSFVSLGFNLIGDGNATAAFNKPGDQSLVMVPGLGPLANNGGPTQTHALQTGSPAIDKGTNAGCPATDQRGVKRRQGPRCDIGAFELEQPNIPPIASNDSYGGVEDRTLNVPARGVLRNDADAEGDALRATRVSGPGKGTLTLRPDGSFTYKPKKNFSGVVSFVYRASDGEGGSDNATVTIRVRARPG